MPENARIKIKICGLTREEEVACVNELRPDYIGFVFYPPSKRALVPERAALLKKMLAPEIKAVGVFVNVVPEFIASLARAKIIDLAQLHGDEDEEYCRNLRRLTDVPLIKAIRVRSEESLRNLERYPVDYFLFDTYRAGKYGGTGERISLEISQSFSKPYFLAGGLDAGNVAQVLQKSRAFAVDVSGGVEDEATGRKDAKKIAAFIAQVRKKGEMQDVER